MIDRTFSERKRENSLEILFCLYQARSSSTVAGLGSAGEYWGRQICKPQCDCCIILFLSIWRPRSVFFKVGILNHEITLTASFVSSPLACSRRSVLLFGFVVIRKVGAKWKFKFLVELQQTSGAWKTIHDVKTRQVSKEFVCFFVVYVHSYSIVLDA